MPSCYHQLTCACIISDFYTLLRILFHLKVIPVLSVLTVSFEISSDYHSLPLQYVEPALGHFLGQALALAQNHLSCMPGKKTIDQ